MVAYDFDTDRTGVQTGFSVPHRESGMECRTVMADDAINFPVRIDYIVAFAVFGKLGDGTGTGTFGRMENDVTGRFSNRTLQISGGEMLVGNPGAGRWGRRAASLRGGIGSGNEKRR